MDSWPIGPACAHDADPDAVWGLHESCADIRIADDSVPFADDLRYRAAAWDDNGVRYFAPKG